VLASPGGLKEAVVYRDRLFEVFGDGRALDVYIEAPGLIDGGVFLEEPVGEARSAVKADDDPRVVGV